jgi:hypothetical protein
MACVGVLPRVAVLVALLAAPSPGAAQTQPPPAPSVPAVDPAPAPATLPADPERLRRALDRPATLLMSVTKVEQFDTTFRVTVTQKPFSIWDFWGRDAMAGSSARGSYFSAWHSEYLRMVTPEAGRRAALYPGGMVPAMPGITALTQAIENTLKARARRKAREEVQQALEDFFAAHPEARAPAPAAPDKLPPS